MIQKILLSLTTLALISCTPEPGQKRDNANNNLSGLGTFNGGGGSPPPIITPPPTSTSGGGPGVTLPNYYGTVNCQANGTDRPYVTDPEFNKPIWCRVIQSRGRGIAPIGNPNPDGIWDTLDNYVNRPACTSMTDCLTCPTTINGYQNDCEIPFVSNNNFEIRFNVRKFPTACDADDMATSQFAPSHIDQYNYLQFDVKVYEKGNIGNPVLQVSDVINLQSLNAREGQYQPQVTAVYQVPQNRLGTNTPLYIEISNVRSDYGCYWSNGYSYCPAELVVQGNKCWSVEVQVATDRTQTFI